MTPAQADRIDSEDQIEFSIVVPCELLAVDVSGHLHWQRDKAPVRLSCLTSLHDELSSRLLRLG
jgi:hypothetical protein